MTDHQLYEFLVLASSLSFSRAADILFISQSSLSRHMAQLEKELNCQLFIRTTRSVRLTDCGIQLWRDLPEYLNFCSAAKERLRLHCEIPTGKITAAISEDATTPDLLSFFHEFNKKNPKVDMKVQVFSEDALSSGASSIGADLVFSLCEVSLPDSSYVRHPLQQVPACIVMPMEASFQKTYEVAFRELYGKRLCLPNLSLPGSHYKILASLAQKATHKHVEVQEEPNITSALYAVYLEQGFTILPFYYEKRLSTKARVERISDTGSSFTLLAYEHASAESTAASIFLSELTRSLQMNNPVSMYLTPSGPE